jgi:hypothetical protein
MVAPHCQLGMMLVLRICGTRFLSPLLGDDLHILDLEELPLQNTGSSRGAVDRWRSYPKGTVHAKSSRLQS